MQLNAKGKNEVRSFIEEQVIKIPNNILIKIPKDILESLIFYSIKTSEYTIKHPIWTGPFLQKIDLSELSFDDVEWNRETFLDILGSMRSDCNLLSKNPIIDFSYTNASLNLTNGNNSSKYIKLVNCNFEGLDLSHLTLYLHNFVDGDGIIIGHGNNFKNTGIRIITNNEVVNREILGNDDSLINEAHQMINDEIARGVFDGCYINGYLILNAKITSQGDSKRKETLQQEYAQYKQHIIDNIEAEIQKNMGK